MTAIPNVAYACNNAVCLPWPVGLRSAVPAGLCAPADRKDRSGHFKANDHSISRASRILSTLHVGSAALRIQDRKPL